MGRTPENGRTRDRLGSTRVGDVDELLEKDCVLVVVPVTKDDGELLVVLVFLLWWVDDHRRTKTIHILPLV